jgi:hypothetical protein
MILAQCNPAKTLNQLVRDRELLRVLIFGALLIAAFL